MPRICTRKTTVDGGAPGVGDDAGVLVLEEEEMEVDDEVSSPPHFSSRYLKGTNGNRGCQGGDRDDKSETAMMAPRFSV